MSKKLNGSKKRQVQPRNRWLPLLVSLGGLALLAAAFLALRGNNGPGAEVEVTGAPAIKVDQELVDLGDVKVEQVVSASFVVTNAGDQPLRFEQEPYIEVAAGCWPPTPAIGSMVIQPGESTQLSMEFTMHAGMEGKHDFRVHLLTNDPQQPERTLTVLSNWVPWKNFNFFLEVEVLWH